MKSNPKILLVDDNPINIRVAANILRTVHYNLSFAHTGEVALKKVNLVHFDLILLDIMMPGIDGFEVCSILKSNPETRDIPIIFLTARTESENVVKGFDLGGADYVMKPFNGKELLARVETQIKLKRNLDEMNALNAKLLEANETKDKMFSIISHDLIGPFGSIRESLELIANGEVIMDYEVLLEYVKTIWQTTSKAYDLLENLLYWARNQQGRMVYLPKMVNLNQLIHETYHLLEGMAKNKNITLQTFLNDEFGVFADKNAVKTILRNLVANAIKFTNPGGSIETRVENPGGGFLQISVRDTGIGMDEDTAGKIFSKFKNDPRWGTKGEKGVGLGLVIAREFVEKHNGKIWVESTIGQGSTFYFTLPVTKS
ncbi:MAG: hybrid sensor histidine kinase/response regulator [Sphingobacteriia bacterium]|nr:hybrid sensor histidine kinase/response regulator [Sphingobacteriia bacterium]